MDAHLGHKLIFLDFESYYDDAYSLRHMTPAEYILDPRWETIILAVKEDKNAGYIIDGPDVGKFFSSLGGTSVTTVCFNALFDNCVAAWQYAYIPRRILCTMRMAVALRGHMLQGHSLAAIGVSLGLGVKGTAIQDVKGYHRKDIIERGHMANFQRYALNDNELNAAIFYLLAPEFPASERRVMDRVLRCAIDPKLQVDQLLLRQYQSELQTEKANLLHAAGVTDISELRSTAKFSELLRAQGIEPEMKVTATGNEAPAFAKTDAFMERLQQDENPMVQALACARLGARSTIEESRAARISSIAALSWPNNKPMLPVPLNYSAAHTHRLGGTWHYNMQNLPTGRGGKSNKLRQSVIAPEGYELVVGDLEQIECRVNAWFCGQSDLLESFRQGKDPYSALATLVFGYVVTKETHELERFIGKSGELGLGFQCGATKFYNMVLRSARGLGMDLTPLQAIWTPEIADRTVRVYRDTHMNIVYRWSWLDHLLRGPWLGRNAPTRCPPVTIGFGYVELPNGMRMSYTPITGAAPNLAYQYGKEIHSIYGGRFLENIVQALARIILMNAAMRLWDRGYQFKMQAHDELVFVVPSAAVDEAMRVVKEELTRPVSWARDLPLGAAVSHGKNYADAK